MYVEGKPRKKSNTALKKIIGGVVMIAVCLTVGALVIYAIKMIAESEMPPTKEPLSSKYQVCRITYIYSTLLKISP
jgi:hypothetical protein